MRSIGRFRLVAAVAGLGVLNLLCASVALADATSSKTYWVKPNGSDDADCLSKETAGSVWKGWCIVTNNFKGQAAGASYKPDTLVFCEGTYDFTKLTPGPLRLLGTYGTAYLAGESYDLLVKSETDDPTKTILKGAGDGQGTRAFFMNGNCSFAGLTFEDFDATTIGDNDTARWGGAIHSHRNQCVIGSGWGLSGGASVSNCIFRNCRAVNGGAVAYTHSGGSKFTMTDCEFYENYASGLSAAVHVAGGSPGIPCDFVNCTFATNSTPGASGAVYAADTATARGLKFFGNTFSPIGTALYNAGTKVQMSDCDFHDNFGGKLLYAGAQATVTKCAFSNNVSSAGSTGGLCSGGAYVKCDFISNLVTNMVQNGDVCGICIYDSTLVSNCTFYANTGNSSRYKWGCAIYATQSSAVANWPKVVGCHFEKNGFMGNKNQTYGVACNAVCENCTFIDNMNYADGLYGDFSNCALVNCSVISNAICQSAPRGALKSKFARNCYVKGMYGAGNLACFDNCIFDTAPYMADAMITPAANAPIYLNCIYWDVNDFAYSQGGYAVLSNCFVKGIGAGNCHINGSEVWASADSLKPLLEDAGCVVYPATANLADYKIERDQDGRLRLKKRSSLRDIGQVPDWAKEPGCVDLDGNPRLSAAGTIDLGCYQYTAKPSGLMLLLR